MRPASRHPEGGRHGCRPFSDQAMDGLSENGDGMTHALSGFDVTRKVLSFGYFSLHQQRKVTRRQAKALLVRMLNRQPTERQRPWMTSLRLLKTASRLHGDDGSSGPFALATTRCRVHQQEK